MLPPCRARYSTQGRKGIAEPRNAMLSNRYRYHAEGDSVQAGANPRCLSYPSALSATESASSSMKACDPRRVQVATDLGAGTLVGIDGSVGLVGPYKDKSAWHAAKYVAGSAGAMRKCWQCA